MAITEALRLLITADTAGAVTGIQTVGRTAERELGRTDKSLDRLGGNLTKFGAGMLGVGALAIAGLGKAAQAAGNLEQAVGGTEAVFGEASGAIDKYAKNAADKLGLSERAFRELTTVAGAQLKNLGFSVEEASEQSIKLTEIGADLAATFGGTTQEAVQALGAAFRGEADPAERFGLSLNQTAVNAKAVELGLAESTSSVSGYAKAQATLALIMEQSADAQGQFARESDTLAGRQQRLSAEFENLQASIGEGALPVFETMISVASGAVGVFDDLNESSGGLAGQLAAYGSIGLIVAGGLSFIAGQAILARGRIIEVAAAARAATASLGGMQGALLGLGKAGLVVGALIAVREVLGTIDDEVSKVDLSELENQLLDLAENGEVSGETLTRVFSGIEGSVEGARQATADLDQLDEALARLAARDPDAAAQAFERIQEALRDQGVSADDIEGKFDNYQAALAETDTANRTTGAAIDEATGAMEEQAGATEEAASRLQEYTDKLKGLTDPIFAAQNALVGVRDAQVGVRDAELEVVTATDALNEALASGDQDAIAEATRNLESAQRGLEDAQWKTVESAAQADSALAGLKDALDRGDISTDQFIGTLRNWVAQGFLTQEQANAAAFSVGALAGAADVADSKRVDIPVSVSGVEQSINDIKAIQDRINALHGRDVGIRIVGTAVGAVGGGVLRFHEGGIVPGRRGEEIAAVLQAGERVQSLAEVDAMSRMRPWAGQLGPSHMTVSLVVAGGNSAAATFVTKMVRDGDLQLQVNGERVRPAA